MGHPINDNVILGHPIPEGVPPGMCVHESWDPWIPLPNMGEGHEMFSYLDRHGIIVMFVFFIWVFVSYLYRMREEWDFFIVTID